MLLTRLQQLAIEARLAQIIGADVFDRVCCGIQIGRVEGRSLQVFLPTEEMAREFESLCGPDLSVVASRLLKIEIEDVAVFPDREAIRYPVLTPPFSSP